MGFNIRSKAVAETLEFQLVDEADQPLYDASGKPCMAVVYGPGSKRYAEASTINQNRLLAKVSKGKAASETAEEKRRAHAEFLSRITEKLDLDYVDDEGRTLEGREKFLAIYSDQSILFIAEQVTEKSRDWANFSKGSAKS